MILVKNLLPTQLVITESHKQSLMLGPHEERRVCITPAIKDAAAKGMVQITERRRAMPAVSEPILEAAPKRKRGRPRKVR